MLDAWQCSLGYWTIEKYYQKKLGIFNILEFLKVVAYAFKKSTLPDSNIIWWPFSMALNWLPDCLTILAIHGVKITEKQTPLTCFDYFTTRPSFKNLNIAFLTKWS